ncbi:hypothetical protein JW898_02500 [Candidatus Woesearchaeota archaeon]|nr:hypothetical protein [Candidatus Woesearchaeota archaeon]
MPERQDIVLNAIRRYNERLDKVVGRLRLYEGNERGTIGNGISRLEAEIKQEVHDLGVNPANLAARQALKNRRSTKRLLENILRNVDAGIPLEQALAPLPELGKVSNYQNLIQRLRDAGVVVDVNGRKDAAGAIRNAADYQVVLLDSRFELPAPFSQRLIKDVKPSREESVDAFIRYNVSKEIEKRFGLKLDRLLKSGEKKYAGARRKAVRMMQDRNLQSLAERIVDSLPSFERVYLIPRSKTRVEFEENRLTPEQFYKRAFDALSDCKDYFTITFRGFDVHHPKVLLTTNDSMGMRIHLYSAFLGYLESHGFDVKKREVTGLRDSRAHAATGAVMSKSGSRTNHDPWVSGIPSYRSMPAKAYSMWPDLDCHCGCDDSRYMAVMHRRSQYKASYADMHVVALACDYMKHELDEGSRVLNPFVFPLHDQIDFEQKVQGQVLVLRKEDGDVKTANRGEREWLNMMNISDVGYDRAYTTDFRRARKAMFDMCFRI